MENFSPDILKELIQPDTVKPEMQDDKRLDTFSSELSVSPLLPGVVYKGVVVETSKTNFSVLVNEVVRVVVFNLRFEPARTDLKAPMSKFVSLGDFVSLTAARRKPSPTLPETWAAETCWLGARPPKLSANAPPSFVAKLASAPKAFVATRSGATAVVKQQPAAIKTIATECAQQKNNIADHDSKGLNVDALLPDVVYSGVVLALDEASVSVLVNEAIRVLVYNTRFQLDTPVSKRVSPDEVVSLTAVPRSPNLFHAEKWAAECLWLKSTRDSSEPDTLVPLATKKAAKTSSPVTKKPDSKKPGTETHVVKTLVAKTPNNTPMVKIPISNTPVTKMPFTMMPDTTMPATKVPVTKVAVTKVPVTKVPVTKVPVTKVPVTKVPVTKVPVNKGPVIKVPVTKVPVTKVPVTNVPVSKMPATKTTPYKEGVPKPPVTAPCPAMVTVAELRVLQVEETWLRLKGGVLLPADKLRLHGFPVASANLTQLFRPGDMVTVATGAEGEVGGWLGAWGPDNEEAPSMLLETSLLEFLTKRKVSRDTILSIMYSVERRPVKYDDWETKGNYSDDELEFFYVNSTAKATGKKAKAAGGKKAAGKSPKAKKPAAGKNGWTVKKDKKSCGGNTAPTSLDRGTQTQLTGESLSAEIYHQA